MPERGRRQQIQVSASAALGGMHLHASTGPDGSIGARTGTVGGATVGKTVTTKARTASAACQWPVSGLMRLHEAVTAQAGCNTCDNSAVPWTRDGIEFSQLMRYFSLALATTAQRVVTTDRTSQRATTNVINAQTYFIENPANPPPDKKKSPPDQVPGGDHLGYI